MTEVAVATPPATAPTQNAAQAQNLKNGPPATPAQKAEAVRLHKLVTGKNPDGTPVYKDYSEADALKLAQKGIGAQQVFDQTAYLVKLAKTDPAEFLRQAGHDPSKLSADWWAQQQLEAAESPQAKELRLTKQERDHLKKEKDAVTQKEREAHVQELTTQVQGELYNKIGETLQSLGLPQGQQKFAVRQIANYLALANKKGIDINQIPVPFLAKKVLDDFKQLHTKFYGDLDEDTLASQWDEATLAKASKAYMKKMKIASKGNGAGSPAVGAKPAPKPAPKFMSDREAAALMKERAASLQVEWNKQRAKK